MSEQLQDQNPNPLMVTAEEHRRLAEMPIAPREGQATQYNALTDAIEIANDYHFLQGASRQALRYKKAELKTEFDKDLRS